ncbi:peroxiredoxin [Methanocella sp. CWC-04]|uniref:thioredoxin-dependent peroxiredoxin n=1 Tax=Methanooceanicella nereidis TaxID=2052831 RepID=A0AAP2RAT3_9EURY|nr:peroxiredoxin family protein [Methanocella sp. CWC-04]MCD1293602.1 peroxiredoxin [Methanocella sp. CWC-04]
MYRMGSRPQVGEKAPGFILRDCLGEDIGLSEYKGKRNVILAFYRGQSDKYSMEWLSQLRDDYIAFRGMDTEVLAVGPDNIENTLNIGGRYDIPFKLLCDPGLEVVRQYGVYDDIMDNAMTSAFLIDMEGIIRYMYVGKVPQDVPSNVELIKHLRDVISE